MADRFVTIAVFDQPIEAELARTKLDAEGIECFIADSNLVGINPAYTLAVGGIKLRVHEEDSAAARAALNPVPTAGEESSPGDPGACPRCAGREWRVRERAPWPLRLLVGLMGAAATGRRRRARCRGCGFETRF